MPVSNFECLASTALQHVFRYQNTACVGQQNGIYGRRTFWRYGQKWVCLVLCGCQIEFATSNLARLLSQSAKKKQLPETRWIYVRIYSPQRRQVPREQKWYVAYGRYHDWLSLQASARWPWYHRRMVPKHRRAWQYSNLVVPPGHNEDAHEYVQPCRAKYRQVLVNRLMSRSLTLLTLFVT